VKVPYPAESDPVVQLRPMEADDLDQVLVIERAFKAPWTRDMFLQELRQGALGEARVAARGPLVLGYILWWYVADEVHIVNVAVHLEWRRQGVARLLLDAAFECGRRRDMRIATLEVRSSNVPAVSLYESLAFRRVAVRKGYYADNGEDALVMLKSL
jgi:[ribosomal protein S18]-alanine N-acetyltransferase